MLGPALGLLLAACGTSAPAEISTPTAAVAAIPSADPASSTRLLDWPEFGLDAQRSDASETSSAISAANIGHLRHASVSLPGTVDSSPIYLHGVTVAGAAHNVILVTTTYGRTIAIDADGCKHSLDLHAAGHRPLERQARRSRPRARSPTPTAASSTPPRPTG